MGLIRVCLWNAFGLFLCAGMAQADAVTNAAPAENPASQPSLIAPAPTATLTNAAPVVAPPSTNAVVPANPTPPANLPDTPPLAVAQPSLTAAPTIAVGAVPSWVKPIDPDSVTVPATAEVENGIDYSLIDCQALVESNSDFYHYTRRVTNEKGLEDAGEIKGEFDPSYQTLTLHWLKVKRDGVWLDRTATDHFQLLRQEKNLDEQMLDGRYSADCHLQDLRVGDEIDYAYTVTGGNPVFGGKYVSSFSTTWSSPVHLFSQRVIVPTGRKLNYKSFTNKIDPTVTTNPDGSQLLEWKSTEVPAVFDEDNTPAWYDTFGWVQLSEFATWKDVVDWGLGNYDFNAPLSPELQAKIDEIAKNNATPEDRALAAIHFVQDEIRYLGIEMGSGSYKPTPAALACSHRFGDCKDKAFLCVVMLRALGLEAYPVLVSTDYRQDTDKLLPSPIDFDHCILQVIVDGRTYWIDATRDSQRGKLHDLYIGDYKRALVLKPGNDALSSMTVSPESMPTEVVDDKYTVKSVTEPTLLTVHTVYTGLAAETTRSDFAESSIDKIQKEYVDYYAGKYPKIKATKTVRFQDFPDDNRFEVWEEYSISGFWARKKDDAPWKAEFSPHIISDAIGNAPPPQRTSPYHVSYPSDVSEDIEVDMFEDWKVDPTTADQTTPYFIYTDHPTGDKNIIHFRYHYKTLVPFVMPENMAEYHDEIKKLLDYLDYNLTYTPPAAPAAPAPPPPFQPNWPVIAMELMIFCVGSYLAFRIYMMRLPYPPPPVLPDLQPYNGVGGWLVLVILGLLWRIGINVKALCTDYGVAWDLNRWNQVTVPGAASYDPLWAPTLLFELAFTLLFPMLSLLALVLLFQRRWIFPRIMITVLLAALAIKLIDIGLTSQIPLFAKLQPGPDPDIGKIFLQTIIWVPYLLVSKRVKATFRR